MSIEIDHTLSWSIAQSTRSGGLRGAGRVGDVVADTASRVPVKFSDGWEANEPMMADLAAFRVRA